LIRYSRYFMPTTKETPSEAEVVSHRLMLRAGLIRKVASGIYDYLPAGLRVEPEPYEQRWISAYVRAEAQLGQAAFRKGGEANLRQAVVHFEAARSADPDRVDRDLVHGLDAELPLRPGAPAVVTVNSLPILLQNSYSESLA